MNLLFFSIIYRIIIYNFYFYNKKSFHPLKRTKALLTCYHLSSSISHDINLLEYNYIYSCTITCTNPISLNGCYLSEIVL